MKTRFCHLLVFVTVVICRPIMAQTKLPVLPVGENAADKDSIEKKKSELAAETRRALEQKKLDASFAGESWKGLDVKTVIGEYSGASDGNTVKIRTITGKQLSLNVLESSMVRSSDGKEAKLLQQMSDKPSKDQQGLSFFQFVEKDGNTVLFRWHKPQGHEIPPPGTTPPPPPPAPGATPDKKPPPLVKPGASNAPVKG
jgi:hypothetical protein